MLDGYKYCNLFNVNPYFKFPIINPNINPNTANTIPACNAALVAIDIENELFSQVHTKNTRPPNIPIKIQVNRAYPRFGRIDNNSNYIRVFNIFFFRFCDL
jgi:hypothetical protein